MVKPINELLDFCIVNVEKPNGVTSFQACEKVKIIFNAKSAGHFGTLDPMVTGVLPVALNKACKLSAYFMKKDKEYVGKMYLHKEFSEKELKEKMKEFVGKINQKPPRRSSVKRVLRERTVNKFEFIGKNGKVVSFHTDVEAGTYIRKLISDLGEKIGGAHMIELRRIRAGIFKEKESWKIEEIEKAFKEYENGNEKLLRKILIPGEIVREIIPEIQVKEIAVDKLLHGSPIFKEYTNDKIKSDKVSVFYEKRLIGIYRVVKEEEDRIIAWPEVVFS